MTWIQFDGITKGFSLASFHLQADLPAPMQFDENNFDDSAPQHKKTVFELQLCCKRRLESNVYSIKAGGHGRVKSNDASRKWTRKMIHDFRDTLASQAAQACSRWFLEVNANGKTIFEGRTLNYTQQIIEEFHCSIYKRWQLLTDPKAKAKAKEGGPISIKLDGELAITFLTSARSSLLRSSCILQ